MEIEGFVCAGCVVGRVVRSSGDWLGGVEEAWRAVMGRRLALVDLFLDIGNHSYSECVRKRNGLSTEGGRVGATKW